MGERKSSAESPNIQVIDKSNILLVTANVGTLFEDPLGLLHPWLEEFMLKIKELRPHFVALHMQEVGGKTYEKASNSVKEFVKLLCEDAAMRDFSAVQIYMDENFNSLENFTALGSLYFAHKNLSSIRIWNFSNGTWEQPAGKNIYFGNIENISTKEKSKFPLKLFPECKWSRKGFMRTRWDINGTVVEFVNIHLFHDASNLKAREEYPSVYSQRRRQALIHTLERFLTDKVNEPVPYFVFGDFNFRCDTEGVTKELTKNLTEHRVSTSNVNSAKICYRDEDGENVLIIGKKEFNHVKHQNKFKEEWLKKYDRDWDIFRGILCEYDIPFPPSYPYKEEPHLPTEYMITRCPSWCDRILMSPQIPETILASKEHNPYNVIGDNVCMGDHKPVYLNVQLKTNQGIVKPQAKVSDCLHHISKMILSNDSDNSGEGCKMEPKSQFIRLNQKFVSGNRESLYSGMIKNDASDCIKTKCWIKSNVTNVYIILKETQF
ncbi:inositol polyphosphate-5-phosphatase A isoform X1 [Anastrepha obliqua]|uniref:inositol polyphosphate-5-phosphatase A isoform X1 n=1 Tax=Anastrepha obliqua TaxID=95512 RepID=UPI00240972AE|nr:inositol polyphosphate-5-phosphatase A isoform X1 [Anastrepha obliqua]XP_054745727.1 inositol polyphosphate-5-phosphatase A isoform X1 [Anastrepha obliqua]XP_054745731.1 inositol polyphosphate-5-phosphatase A isoform X1 [Anastrepha obliqua]XP_054745736.1 inositol polyphosphate-5-phosphatase A isoform X1 [Anastrepha obliqua]